MIGEKIANPLPLSQLTEDCLDKILELKIDSSKPSNDPDNTKRGVLRAIFRPVALYCLDRGQAPETFLSPEHIIRSVLEESALEIPAELRQEITSRYGQNQTSKPQLNWLDEALKISLAGNTHPLDRLSQIVVGKLSDHAKQELTKAELLK